MDQNEADYRTTLKRIIRAAQGVVGNEAPTPDLEEAVRRANRSAGIPLMLQGDRCEHRGQNRRSAMLRKYEVRGANVPWGVQVVEAASAEDAILAIAARYESTRGKDALELQGSPWFASAGELLYHVSQCSGFGS